MLWYRGKQRQGESEAGFDSPMTPRKSDLRARAFRRNSPTRSPIEKPCGMAELAALPHARLGSRMRSRIGTLWNNGSFNEHVVAPRPARHRFATTRLDSILLWYFNPIGVPVLRASPGLASSVVQASGQFVRLQLGIKLHHGGSRCGGAIPTSV